MLFQKAFEKFGAVDALINNAGVAPKKRKNILEITEDDFDYVMNINLKGTYFMTQDSSKNYAKSRWRIYNKHRFNKCRNSIT